MPIDEAPAASSQASLFAAAVRSAIFTLEEAGFDIVEAEFLSDFTPHVVARKDGQLLFVVVQALQGPALAQFSSQVFEAEIRPWVESIASHPKAEAVADLAAEHGAHAVLAVVCILPVDDPDDEASPRYLTKVFPMMDISPSGRVRQASQAS